MPLCALRVGLRLGEAPSTARQHLRHQQMPQALVSGSFPHATTDQQAAVGAMQQGMVALCASRSFRASQCDVTCEYLYHYKESRILRVCATRWQATNYSHTLDPSGGNHRFRLSLALSVHRFCLSSALSPQVLKLLVQVSVAGSQTSAISINYLQECYRRITWMGFHLKSGRDGFQVLLVLWKT